MGANEKHAATYHGPLVAVVPSRGPAIKVGDQVKVGRGSIVYEVRELRAESDAAGIPYVMALISNSDRTVGQFVESTLLRLVAKADT